MKKILIIQGGRPKGNTALLVESISLLNMKLKIV